MNSVVIGSSLISDWVIHGTFIIMMIAIAKALNGLKRLVRCASPSVAPTRSDFLTCKLNGAVQRYRDFRPVIDLQQSVVLKGLHTATLCSDANARWKRNTSDL